jgi:nitrogen fixation protein NifU and related proteins
LEFAGGRAGFSSATTAAQHAHPCDTLLMFSATLLEHFQHPRNAGELPNANVKIEVTNPVCGDILKLSAAIENKTIREVRFLCRGCTASIACASFLTESIQGRKLAALDSLTAESLAASLGGLPAASFHAAQLAYDALQFVLRAAAK